MLKKNDWNCIFIFAVIIGFVIGVAASLWPQTFFYEAGVYYSDNIAMRLEGGTLLNVMTENIQYFVYFLSMRFLIPVFVLTTGMFQKGTTLLRIYIMFGLAAVSFQAVLIFGAIGMEGWFQYQLITLLPESFYLLAAMRVYFFKKQEIHTIQSAAGCAIQMFLMLLCGAGLEILLV